MNRRQFLMLAMAAALAACGGVDLAPPQPTTVLPTTPPVTELPHSPATATLPVETPTTAELSPETGPTETTPALPEAAPPPAGWQEFIFSEYSLLAAFYDPAVWIPDKGMGQGMLLSALVPGCQISDLPAGEPPANLELTTIGPFAFRTARLDDPATGLRQVWLLMESGRPAAYEQDAITPIFLVSAAPADIDRCLEAAVPVLASLHNSGVP